MNLPEALKSLRIVSNLNARELAMKLDISYSYVYDIEKGQRTKPSLNILEKYSQYFGIPISAIVFLAEEIDNTENALSLINSLLHIYKVRKI